MLESARCLCGTRRSSLFPFVCFTPCALRCACSLFSLGAKSSMELAKSKLVCAAVGFHCSFLTKEDAPLLAATGRPLLFNCAAVDNIFTPELRGVFEAELKGKTGTFLDYEGTTHGFGARPEGAVEQTASLKAHKATMEFLKTHA